MLEAIGLCVLFGFVNGEYVRGLFFKSDMHQIMFTGKINDRAFSSLSTLANSEVLCKIEARTLSAIEQARE